MTTHTPGPWVPEGFTQTHGRGTFYGGLIVGPDAEIIAQCVSAENSPILSAAPDLLHACKRLLASIYAHAETGEVHPSYTLETREAIAAIAKAEATP